MWQGEKAVAHEVCRTGLTLWKENTKHEWLPCLPSSYGSGGHSGRCLPEMSGPCALPTVNSGSGWINSSPLRRNEEVWEEEE